ncbi:MAG TPA: nucleotidyltransferase [Terriglobales bacterium]|nr:nucleotidyltransferase [Terriglobales bacterium]
MSSLPHPSPSPSPHKGQAAGHGLAAEQRQLFQRVLRALTRGGVTYSVAGAFAMRHHTGIWRFTKDLDLFLPADRIEVALTLCRTAGLITEVTDPVWLAKAWAGNYFVDMISGMSNGVFWVTPDWIERAVAGEVFGQKVRMLAPEEMILSKLFVTRRERFDGSDVCHLIYCCGSLLDWPRLIAATGDHWELLLWHLHLYRYVYPSASVTVPEAVWTELEERWREARRESARKGAPSRPFRGSLIDPLMFQPDVAQWGLENLEDRSRRKRLQEGRE